MKKATGTKTIRTERLVLKKIMPWRLAQAQWLTLPQMAEFNMAKAPYTKKFTRDFICRKFVKYRKKDYYFWGIMLKNKMIGYVELMPHLERQFFLNYKISPNCWNNGYGTEAISAVLDYCKTQPIDKVYSRCDEANIGSKRLMEKSGMKQIGDVETNPIIQYTNGDTAKAYYYLKKY